MIRNDIIHGEHGKIIRKWSDIGAYLSDQDGNLYEDVCYGFESENNKTYFETNIPIRNVDGPIEKA